MKPVRLTMARALVRVPAAQIVGCEDALLDHYGLTGPRIVATVLTNVEHLGNR